VLPPSAADRSTQIDLALTDGRELALFIDPYTRRVLGERDEQNHLQYYALKLHGDLLIGPVGDYLIELATCWGIVLLVTGAYLWWPRKGSRLWGVWLPRLSRRNPRVFWRDLHAVTGFYSIALVGFLLVTGLPWAGFWGTSFADVWNRYPPYVFNGVPQVTGPTGRLNNGPVKPAPWAAETLPMPTSNSADPHALHRGGAGQDEHLHRPAVTLDSVIVTAERANVFPGYTVTLPNGPTGVYSVSVAPDDPRQQATLHIDQYTGDVLVDGRWSDYGLVAKAVSVGIVTHEGRLFGLANQLLMLGACLALITMSVSGTVMWWRRRPSGRLGAPAFVVPVHLSRGVVAIAVVMGLALPLMGLSLVLVLTLDALVLSRLPRLRTAIG
jgi:uncharacterized iron-regulated membrane protein